MYGSAIYHHANTKLKEFRSSTGSEQRYESTMLNKNYVDLNAEIMEIIMSNKTKVFTSQGNNF